MKNKLLLLLAFYFISAISVFAQNSVISEIAEKVEQDSLVKFVRILAGEDSVIIKGEKDLILNRANAHDDNELAANYLMQELNRFGIEASFQKYTSAGKNVLGVQEGTTFKDLYYIISAHYDAVTNYCADDNASGCAVVLEAARILSKYEPQFSIIYAFWDQEEIGLIGSKYFASNAYSDDYNILGVINIDMIAYDSNDDGIIEIQSSTISNSQKLAEDIVAVNEEYNIGLSPNIDNPGNDRSDHKSFWDKGYTSVSLIESFETGDSNPYYHSNLDRIREFNLKYYTNGATLAIASLADKVRPGEILSTYENNPGRYSFNLEQNYPNPFNPTTTISYSVAEEGFVSITIYDFLGREISNPVSELKSPGVYKEIFDGANLASGNYLVVMRCGDFISSRKISFVK